MFEIQLTIISLAVGFLLGRAFPKKEKKEKNFINIYGDEE